MLQFSHESIEQLSKRYTVVTRSWLRRCLIVNRSITGSLVRESALAVGYLMLLLISLLYWYAIRINHKLRIYIISIYISDQSHNSNISQKVYHLGRSACSECVSTVFSKCIYITRTDVPVISGYQDRRTRNDVILLITTSALGLWTPPWYPILLTVIIQLSF